MKQNDTERMLKESRSLIPDDALRARVLQESVQIPMKMETVTPASVPTSRWVGARRWVPLVASLMLCMVLTLAGVLMYRTEYDTVYLDVNPSVELSVNRFSRIIGVHYLNADAEACFSDISLQNCEVKEGMTALLDALDRDGYLEHGEIYLGINGKSEKQAEKLLGKLEKKIEQENEQKGYAVPVHVGKISTEEKQAAAEAGISPNKYHLIRTIIGQDGSFSPEDLKDMKMKDLRELLDEEISHGNGKKDRDDTATDKGKGKTEKTEQTEKEKNNGKAESTPPESAPVTEVTDKKRKSKKNS